MSNEESGFAASRRTPRQGVGGSPVGSWLTIALAVVAVIAGFLILRNINNDSSAASPDDDSSTEVDPSTSDPGDTLVEVSVPETDVPTATTPVVRTTDGASVLIANANTQGGSASGMTETLAQAGYTMIDPTDASGANIEVSIVYFVESQEAAEAVARSVALDLGGVDVLPVSTPPPTADGDIGEAGVLVLLGNEQAGRTIEELASADAEPDAGGGAAPNPSDGEIPATAPADADTGGDAEDGTEDGTEDDAVEE